MVNISIFGSCVTRDAIEVWKTEDPSVTLKSYVARQSVISAVSSPVSYDDAAIKLESAFQKRMVIYDLKKSAFELFAGDQSEYLLVDFIDERFNLVALNGGLVTRSNELLKASILPEGYRMLRRERGAGGEFSFQGKSISQYEKEFIDRLLSIYPPERIILHVCKMCNEYIDIDGTRKPFDDKTLNANEEHNALLDYMHQIFRELVPTAPVIDLSDRQIADATHKWKLSPMHYQPEYYQDVVRAFDAIVLR